MDRLKRGFLLLGALLLGGIACDRNKGTELASGGTPEGPGVVLNFKKKQALWVDVRSTPEGRVLGWSQKSQTPSYVIYSKRGFNPVFTSGSPVRVVWIDQDRVVRIDQANDPTDRSISPPQEVTAALVAPMGSDIQITAGDQLILVDMNRGEP